MRVFAMAFLVVVDKSVDKFCTNSEPNDIESRFSALESSIKEIKNLLFQNKGIFNSQSTKEFEGKGRGRDLNPRRGLHRSLFDKCTSMSTSLSLDSPFSSSNWSLELLLQRSQNQELCSDVTSQNCTIGNQNHLAVLQLKFSQNE
jgi:hypothetical protein